MHRFASLAVVCAAAMMSGSTCSDGGFSCECFPCFGAVTVLVVDQDGAAATGDWTIEATFGDQPVDTSLCDPQSRGGSNNCTFGEQVGIYQAVLRTVDGEKPFTARFAERAGQNCCQCVAGDTVTVTLP